MMLCWKVFHFVSLWKHCRLWDSDADDGAVLTDVVILVDRATQKKLALDSMYKLEHGVDDQSRGKSSAPTIAKVVEMQAAHKDDFLLNQLARKQFRVWLRWLFSLLWGH